MEPLQSGGGQERGMRSGTVPTPLVVGLGAACEVAQQEMEVWGELSPTISSPVLGLLFNGVPRWLSQSSAGRDLRKSCPIQILQSRCSEGGVTGLQNPGPRSSYQLICFWVVGGLLLSSFHTMALYSELGILWSS